MRLMRIWCVAVVVAALCAGAAASARVTISDDSIVLENQYVRRVLQKDNGVWRTVLFARADVSDAMPVESDEFLICLLDGSKLTIADYVAHDVPDHSLSGDVMVLRVVYVGREGLPDGAPTAVRVEYMLGDEPYLRKRIVLAMQEGGAVDELQVERFRTQLLCDRGGRGQPVFIGSAWFVGLEYPGSETKCENGLVTLAHFPGYAKRGFESISPWTITSKTAVAGVGAKGDPIELAFSDYVDTIRRPPRSFLHYNSWYDWRGDELTLDNLVATYKGLKTNLLDPYDLKMDAFVPDDGYQDPNSIWVPKPKLYPDGWEPLRDALEERGTRLGLWMPLDGTNLNANWGAEQGYEKSDRGNFYCLAGPKYNAAIRAATKRIITQGNIAYFKHDFNHLRCTADGHGHLPDDHHGHEANLDAHLNLLAYERELQPDIFLNITSFVWHSPWWLMHADSIWMNAGDFGYNKDWPQLAPREWAMSYRDAHFYHLYQEQRDLVPVSAMMTHGIINGKYCKLGGDQETLREWSDYVVMYYARGVQLKELYITPDLMTPDRWEVLGRATQWAIANRDVLEKVVMVGGDPRKGDPYAYVHWLGDRCIIAARNPDLPPKTIVIPFDKSVRYRGEPGRLFKGRVIYPYVEEMPVQLTSGQPMTLEIPGCSVMLYEIQPGAAQDVEPAAVPGAIDGEASIDPWGPDGVRLLTRFALPDEEMARCDLYMLVRGEVDGVKRGLTGLPGTYVPERGAQGPGWMLYSMDLRNTPRGPNRVWTSFSGGDPAFGRPGIAVSVWLVADRPVEVGDVPDEILPVPISQQHRRQTIDLLPMTEIKDDQPNVPIRADDLESITAAKLKLSVFDVNSEPQYSGKRILLNGEELAPVPANTGELSAWQEFIIDLDAEQLGRLKMTNTIELTNAGGDSFKFTGLALAVRLPDGRWARTNTDDTVQSSVREWRYFEGRLFEGDRSGPIELTFEQRGVG